MPICKRQRRYDRQIRGYNKVMERLGLPKRLTTIGTIYLTFVALLPEFLLSRTSIPFYLGGTALLIVVVVMIDFITQVQSHLFQHQYEGLLKKTKLKGRR